MNQNLKTSADSAIYGEAIASDSTRFLSAITCGVIQYTRDTKRILFINDIALDLLGYESLEEMQADSFNGVVGTVNPADAKMMNELISTLKTEDDKVEYEYHVTHRNGRSVVCYGEARLLFRGDEEPIIQRCLLDITESRRASEQMVDSIIEAFQMASEATDSIVFIYDRVNQSIQTSSSSIPDWGTGKEAGSVPYAMIESGFVEEAYVDEYLRIFEAIIAGEKEAQGTVGLVTATGETRIFELTLRTMLDHNGQLTDKAAGVFKDITEFELSLLEQHEIVEALSRDYTNVFLIDPDTLQVSVQKQGRYSLQKFKHEDGSDYLYPELVGYYCENLIHPEDREMMIETLDLKSILAKLESTDELTETFRTLQGDQTSYYQLKYIRLSDNRIISGFLDVSSIVEKEAEQRKRLEEALQAAQQANRSKTIFLNNMSHDIRTPMNVIIGFTTLAALHLDDTEKVRSYLEKIEISSEHLLSLINDVLDMSRIESGKVSIEETLVSLPSIVHDIRNIIQSDAANKQLTLQIDAMDIRNETVWCDKLRLSQILLNCLSNAIKFTPPNGTVGLMVQQIESDEDGCARYEFHIHDTGIGMSPEFVQRVFLPFERENSSTVSGIEGTGLGMAITKNIVDIMGGTITVTSEQGVGTEFVVTVSFRVANDRREDNHLVPYLDCIRTLEGLHILLVDDNELNLEIAETLLMESGAEVTCAQDGTLAVEAMENAAPDQFDLILMDVQMPLMNGHDAARAIRAMDDPQKSQIPIIAVTANAFKEDEEAAKAAGMNAHLAKPIDIGNVIDTINRIVIR